MTSEIRPGHMAPAVGRFHRKIGLRPWASVRYGGRENLIQEKPIAVEIPQPQSRIIIKNIPANSEVSAG